MARMVWGLVSDVVDFLFPRYCAVCGTRLTKTESDVCVSCLSGLPKTHAHLMTENPIEKLFWTFIPIGRATSYFFYESSEAHRVLHQLKYLNRPHVGEVLARVMATDLQEEGFFEGMDMIVPVPLHWRRKRSRGYNQCDYIAKGISSVTGLPVAKNVIRRVVNNKTQTRLEIGERRENVEDIFKLVDADVVRGKHVLLVDDVITTGSTVISCGAALAQAGEVTVSVVSLAYAGRTFLVRDRNQM